MPIGCMIDAYLKLIRGLAAKFCLLASLVTAGLMLFTVVDVLMRFVFNNPILGSFEITEIAMVVIVFLAIPWAAAERVNVRVDIVISRFSKPIRRWAEFISCFLSVIVVVLWAYHAIPQAMYIKNLGLQSDMLRIPIYPFYLIIIMGFGVLSLIWLGDLLKLLKRNPAK